MVSIVNTDFDQYCARSKTYITVYVLLLLRHFKTSAHKSRPVATTTCCPNGGSSAEISCKYTGEYVVFDTNTNRCGTDNDVCSGGTNAISSQNCVNQIRYHSRWPMGNHFQWTKGSCDMKVKVRLDGMVAMIHEAEGFANQVKYVSQGLGNMNFFSVPWPRDNYVKDELFPTIDNDCGEGTCSLQLDDTCLCDVTVTNNQAFSENPASIGVIREKLKIGAFPPNQVGGYDAGIDLTFGSETVVVYHKTAPGPTTGTYTQDTIFKLEDDTDEFVDFGSDYVASSNPVVGYVYLKNLDSSIQIGNATNPYYTPPARKPIIIRNPVMFTDLVKPEIRDAHYEIDAHIHHLTSHPTAPPFIAKQMIQHFGIQNPSPSFIESVAMAYKYGQYKYSNEESPEKTFGGKHVGCVL